MLQLLRATDNHGSFRTRGRYSAATVRGTVWSIADRCDGTLTHVTHGMVVVNDFVRHLSVVVHAGHSYLALAKPKSRKYAMPHPAGPASGQKSATTSNVRRVRPRRPIDGEQ